MKAICIIILTMSGFIAEHGKRSNGQLIKRIVLKKGNITKQGDVDVIVSSVMPNMDMSGSLNQSLIKAAGHDFDEFILDNIYKPRPGDTYVVPGFDLPVKNVIFVVSSVWKDDFDKENAYLLRCYRYAMESVRRKGFKTVAFPALGTGFHGYAPDKAARLAIKGIMDRMINDIDEVRIVCNKRKTYDVFKRRLEQAGGTI